MTSQPLAPIASEVARGLNWWPPMVSTDRAGRTDPKTISQGHLGAIGEPIRSPSPFKTTRGHGKPTR